MAFIRMVFFITLLNCRKHYYDVKVKEGFWFPDTAIQQFT